MNFYNEIDEYAAQWLRNLIAAGHIAPGVVDTRSITEIFPDELQQYTQCHFFAGIGVWSYALRLAKWPDSRKVWTGSCPCQPFSAAGGRGGFNDERHLWPHWHWLIEQCRPDVIFGEQVASADGLGWFDLVQSDLEGAGYASAAFDLCAAGVGAPHIRQRLYFVAYSSDARLQGRIGRGATGTERVSGGSDILADTASDRRIWAGEGSEAEAGRQQGPDVGGVISGGSERCGMVGSEQTALFGVSTVADTSEERREQEPNIKTAGVFGKGIQQEKLGQQSGDMGATSCSVADTELHGYNREAVGRSSGESETERGLQQSERCRADGGEQHPGPTNGHWRSADWLLCRDGKWRPVEPGTFPLAHGAPGRVGRLRAYGNSIVPQVAQSLISAFLGSESEL
jgi:DNA (cytosine-5)-methyltransferase 1